MEKNATYIPKSSSMTTSYGSTPFRLHARMKISGSGFLPLPHQYLCKHPPFPSSMDPFYHGNNNVYDVPTYRKPTTLEST